MQQFIKDVLTHRIFVSVAFTETGVTRGLHLHTCSLVAGVAAVLGLVGYLSVSVGGYSMGLEYIGGYKTQISSLENERQYQDEQFKILAQEVGVLQARLERFDAIGERLFNDDVLGERLQDLQSDGQGGVNVPEMTSVPTLDDLRDQMSALSQKAEKAEVSINAGLQMVAQKQEAGIAKPYMWPVVHERAYRSSRYGWRKDPFSSRKAWHSGMDIAAGWNAPIVAAGDGVVVFSGYRYNYGIMVEIRHANGYSTRYGHLKKSTVKNGDIVKAGDLVALMGSTGRSTGPHLHFEVLIDDQKVSPYPFVKDTYRYARRLGKQKKYAAAVEAAKRS